MSQIVSITVINPAPVITAVVIREIGPQGSPGPMPEGALLAENNLSELTNPATARTKLDVYSKGEIDAQAFGDADFDARMQEAWLGFPNGAASLDTNGKVPLDQIPDTLIGQVKYKGVFDASTGETTLGALPEAAEENNGWYFICQTAGTLDGTDFEIGDWIVSTGVAWAKIDNTDAVRTVAGRTGNIILTADDIAETLAKKWWSEALTRGTALAGLNSSVGGNLSTTDTILSALGKLENRVSLNDSKVTGADRLKLDGSNSMTGGLTINSGILTASKPLLDLSQTWNNPAVAFTGLKFNAADTASAGASLLMDLQVGSSSKFKVGTLGLITVANGGGLFDGGNHYIQGASVSLRDSGSFRWSSTGAAHSGTYDTTLLRDAAGVLALRNGLNAQEFRIYNTFSNRAAGNTNLEFLSLKALGNTFWVESFKGQNGGTARDIAFATGGTDNNGTLTEGTERFRIRADGLITASLPTADPAVAGALWNSAGTVKISAG